MVFPQEEEVERMPQLNGREQESQASIRHIQSGELGTYNACGNSPSRSREPSGSREVGAIAENTVESAGSAHAGLARCTSFCTVKSGLTALSLGLRAFAYASSIQSKKTLLTDSSRFIILIIVLAFITITAWQSQYSPTSHNCYASAPPKQLMPLKHDLDINFTAHTPFLAALNEASTLDTLRQHRYSSQRSLEQLTTYVTSNLTCTFLAHSTRNVAEIVSAVWNTHFLAVNAQHNLWELRSIYDNLIPQYHDLAASAQESYHSASPVATKRFVLSAQADAPFVERFYSYVGWDQVWTTYEESRAFARSRRQGLQIAEREAQIFGDRSEEAGILATDLMALEKALSARFLADAAAADPHEFQREELKDWFWRHLASRAGFDAEAFERQWAGMGCVCAEA